MPNFIDSLAILSGGMLVDFPAEADVESLVNYASGAATGTLDVEGGTTPNTPTLSIIAVDGDTVTATIDGDSGVTNRLYQSSGNGLDWSLAGSRSGDGDITVNGLSAGNIYYFVTVSDNSNSLSLPSKLYLISTSNNASVEAALYNILINNSNVTDIIGNRINPNLTKETNNKPYLVYSVLASPFDHAFDGTVEMVRAYLQIVCWSDTYLNAVALKAAVISALDNHQGTNAGIYIQRIHVEDEGDVYEYDRGSDKSKSPGKRITFSIWYNKN